MVHKLNKKRLILVLFCITFFFICLNIVHTAYQIGTSSLKVHLIEEYSDCPAFNCEIQKEYNKQHELYLYGSPIQKIYCALGLTPIGYFFQFILTILSAIYIVCISSILIKFLFDK